MALVVACFCWFPPHAGLLVNMVPLDPCGSYTECSSDSSVNVLRGVTMLSPGMGRECLNCWPLDRYLAEAMDEHCNYETVINRY